MCIRGWLGHSNRQTSGNDGDGGDDDRKGISSGWSRARSSCHSGKEGCSSTPRNLHD